MTLRMKAASAAALWVRGLENDFAVRLGVGGELNHAVEHLIELGILGFERELLRHKVDGYGFDAIELGKLVLELASAVGTVDFVKLEGLFHDGFLSRAGGLGTGRTVTGVESLLADVAHALIEHGVNVIVCERVEDVATVAAKFNQVRAFERAKLMGDGRLGCLRGVGNVCDT